MQEQSHDLPTWIWSSVKSVSDYLTGQQHFHSHSGISNTLDMEQDTATHSNCSGIRYSPQLISSEQTAVLKGSSDNTDEPSCENERKVPLKCEPTASATELQDSLDYSEQINNKNNEPCEERTVSLTDLRKCSDMKSLENNQVPGQEGDTQGPGSEQRLLIVSTALNKEAKQFLTEESKYCVRTIQPLSKDIQVLHVLMENTRLKKIPPVFALFWKRFHSVEERNAAYGEVYTGLKDNSLAIDDHKQKLKHYQQSLGVSVTSR